MTKELPIYVKTAITRFEKAVDTHAFLGTYHPDNHEKIKAKYLNAKNTLKKAILRFKNE